MTVIIPSRPARPIRVDGGGRIPAGGTTGQALVKSADADYATTWATVSGGGGVTDGDKGDITVSGSGATWTIDAGAVTNAKAANMATATIKGRATAGSGDPEDLTGTQATALLDTFSSGAKGLVPASGGGTTNFLRADGTFAAPPGGGGSPGGSSGELQYNNAGAFAGAADVEIEGGQLRLPAIATPTAPAADGLKLFGTKIMGPVSLGYNGPDGNFHSVQDSLGEFTFARYQPAPSSTSIVGDNSFSMTAIGTATSASVSITNLHTMMIRVDMLVAAASTTAIAGLRGNQIAWRVGRDANAPGGFFYRCIWGPATGVATATTRALCGMQNVTTAPTDVEPSTLVNGVWMGWDAADANIQVMHNDAAGAATKIDLGASFPVPTTDRSQVYELQLYSPNSTTQSVYYRVIRYNTTDRTIAAESTGTITTNLPANTVLLAPRVWMSVGGTSSVIGAAVMGIYIGREY